MKRYKITYKIGSAVHKKTGTLEELNPFLSYPHTLELLEEDKNEVIPESEFKLQKFKEPPIYKFTQPRDK